MSDNITFTGEELRNIFLQQNEDMMNRQAAATAKKEHSAELDKLAGQVGQGSLDMLGAGYGIIAGKGSDPTSWVAFSFKSIQLLTNSCKLLLKAMEDEPVPSDAPGITQPAAAANTNAGINRAPISEEGRAGGGPLPGVKIAAGPAI